VASTTVSAAANTPKLLAEIDELCKCTGLQRRSGVLSCEAGYVTLLMSADGVTKRYWIELLAGHPATFGIEWYKPHYQLPLVKDAATRKFYISVVERLDKCSFSWAHYGKPQVAVDAPYGFRVRYRSMPEKAHSGFSTVPFIYFLMTPKGTVCSVRYGE
jgi:hypothetical protein